MAFSAPAGGIITQTGTDTSLAGLSGNAGVTHTSLDHLDIYDLGTNRLRIDGTLTINGASDGDREMLVLGVDGATQNVDIDIGPTGILIVGSIDTQGGVEFNQEQFWPSIFEDASIDFGEGNGNISNDGGTTDAFLNVEGGGRLEWYGCISSTGGMRFKGARDGASVDEAQVVIRGGVLDARRVTERASGEADNFIYTYTDELDIAAPNGDTVGFTILTMTTTGASEKGLAIIQLGEPISLRGYRPVFSSQALGGSNSASINLAYTIEDYTGIIGISGSDNIDLRSASIASNTSVITFLNSVKGSILNLATQDPGFAAIVARQSVRGTLVDSAGSNRTDAVMATENKNSVITEDAIAAGAFNLGNIELATWNADNPPTPTYNNPSNTSDDLWNFYTYSYLGRDQERLNVRLRGVGGTDIEFIAPDDISITETIRANVDAYVAISDLSRFYDRQKSYKVDNVGVPTLATAIAQALGTIVDVGDLNVILDATAGSAWNYNPATTPDTITVNPSTAPNLRRIGDTRTTNLTETTSISVAYPTNGDGFGNTDNIAANDVAYIIVANARGGANTYTTPSGWVEIGTELLVGGSPTTPPGLNVYRRVLTGAESGSVTVTGNVSARAGIQMIVYRDADVTTPEDVGRSNATGTTGDPNPAAVTTATANAMVLAIAIGNYNQTVLAAPASYSNLRQNTTPAASVGSQTFTTPGSTTFVVPAGVTSMTMKAWGAGGGGGGSHVTNPGARGGGGGFAHATQVAVTPGETLNIFVGGGGGGGGIATAVGDGGGGGGRAGVQRQTGSVNLLLAGGGGGGGGGDNSAANTDSTGGAGGGATGQAGGDASVGSLGGGGGTAAAGGTGGAGTIAGANGAANTGGGGGGNSATGTGTGTGGTQGGGTGGLSIASFGSAGGGGGGRFGGGGGGGGTSGQAGGGGGGGGSNLVTGTVQANVQGSGITGAGQGDTNYPAGTGNGGNFVAASAGLAGQRGAVYLSWNVSNNDEVGLVLSSAERKVVAAGAEDPAIFDFSGSRAWATTTFGIRQNSAGGATNFGKTTKFNTLRTTGIVTTRNGATINGVSSADRLTIDGDVTMDDIEDLSYVIITGDLRIQTAGTYNFVGVTVNGDILNDDAGGNVQINATGGSVLSTSEPGIGNGEVNIVNAVNITLTEVIADSEVRLYAGTKANAAAATEIDGVESSGTTVILTHNNVAQPAYIVVHKENYVTKYFEFASLSGVDTSIPAGQQFDINYRNPV